MITIVHHSFTPNHCATTTSVGEYDPSEHRYALGYAAPRYPMPATEGNADLATSYRWICGHCPNVTPCNICIDEFMDAMEYHLEIDYGY